MGAVHKRERVVEEPRAPLPAPGRAAGAEHGHGPADAHEPRRARLVQVDGRPVAIEFTCPCSRRSLIEIELEAPEGQR